MIPAFNIDNIVHLISIFSNMKLLLICVSVFALFCHVHAGSTCKTAPAVQNAMSTSHCIGTADGKRCEIKCKPGYKVLSSYNGLRCDAEYASRQAGNKEWDRSKFECVDPNCAPASGSGSGGTGSGSGV